VPIVTSNRDLIGISGMSEFWHQNFNEELLGKSIEAQVDQLLSTSLSRSQRQELIELVREKNNLDRLIQTIVQNV
jgi:actin-related protein